MTLTHETWLRDAMKKDHKRRWEHYRDTRKGTYEFRSRTRYAAVRDRLISLGLRSDDSICDVGAGEQQFGKFMREQGWTGRYTGMDAVIDGTDLNTLERIHPSKFVVCIEVLEHLYNPARLLRMMYEDALRGLVITTPNSAAVDVIACDQTHVSVVTAEQLLMEGLTVRTESWFGTPHDSLIAWGAR